MSYLLAHPTVKGRPYGLVAVWVGRPANKLPLEFAVRSEPCPRRTRALGRVHSRHAGDLPSLPWSLSQVFSIHEDLAVTPAMRFGTAFFDGYIGQGSETTFVGSTGQVRISRAGAHVMMALRGIAPATVGALLHADDCELNREELLQGIFELAREGLVKIEAPVGRAQSGRSTDIAGIGDCVHAGAMSAEEV